MKFFKTIIDETINEIEHNQIHGIKKYSTGFENIDSILYGGIKPPSTIILGGRPGTGKTTFVNQICYNFIKNYNEIIIIYYSLEMSYSMQARKFMSLHLNCEIELLESCNIEVLKTFTEDLKIKKILMINESVTTNEIESHIKERIEMSKNKDPIQIVIVLDHSRLITKPYSKSEKDKLDDLSFKFLEFKKKYNTINFILTQLNRSSDMVEFRLPMQSDVYGSDSLVQDSDIVWLLSKFPKNAVVDGVTCFSENMFVLSTAKNRFGPEKNMFFEGQLEKNKFVPII